jgi:pyruvate dehydrogenase E2 component (dihydrolipoamide acetyltransferase)
MDPALTDREAHNVIARVRLPKVSANVDEETVTAWLKQEGDPVARGEPLLEVTTDKVCIEVESPRDGVLRKILAEEKSVLPVGYVIALIGDESDSLPDVAAENSMLLEKSRQLAGRRATSGRRGGVRGRRKRVRATPAARRMAREQGLDLAKLAAEISPGVITRSVLKGYLAGESK